MRLTVAVALAAVLAVPPLAEAQTSGGDATTFESGPKRVRVPGAEPAETATETGTDAGTETATGAASTDDAPIEVFPEGEALGAPESGESAGQAAGAETPTDEPQPAEAAGTSGEPAPTETAEAPSASTEEPAEAAATDEGTQTRVVADARQIGNQPFVGDYTIGDPDAPVQVIEYVSFTCPHCAAFHAGAWEELKKDYIDPGKIGFTLREVYLERFGLWASMTARCGGEAGFYPMADQFLSKQEEWTKAENIAEAIQQIGRRAGLTGEQLKTCLENQDFAKLLVEEYQTNAAADEVSSTPTFVLRGPGGEKTVSGSMPYEEFRALIEEVSAGS